MPLKICIYEDDKFDRFAPISLTRPVYCMRAGILPLFRRVERFFHDPEICLAARDNLAAVTAAEWRDYPVNIIKRSDNSQVLFINGRLRDPGDLPGLVEESRLSTIFKNGGETIAVLFRAESIKDIPKVATPDDYMKKFRELAEEIPDFDTTATMWNYCWDIMGDIKREITDDFAFLKKQKTATDEAVIHPGSHLIAPESIHLGTGVEVFPGAVLDASDGPIYIDSFTKIESQAALYGPCYVGPNSVIVAGKIAGSSIGHTCRVGGEVEESIFQAYVNKYHAGFIGHSYVGAWVNFGAMTTNSDLKNNYSQISVSLGGEIINTGSIKIGSFIGDHTKFGIGTLLNTGINIGVGCNLFGGELITDKEVPSFSWGGAANRQQYQIDKAIETARKTADRRHVNLGKEDEKLLRSIFDNSLSGEGILVF